VDSEVDTVLCILSSYDFIYILLRLRRIWRFTPLFGELKLHGNNLCQKPPQTWRRQVIWLWLLAIDRHMFLACFHFLSLQLAPVPIEMIFFSGDRLDPIGYVRGINLKDLPDVPRSTMTIPICILGLWWVFNNYYYLANYEMPSPFILSSLPTTTFLFLIAVLVFRYFWISNLKIHACLLTTNCWTKSYS